MGGPRKELMKKKKGIVATGGMSSKPDANFLELKKKSATSLQCPYCDRDPFKQRDRLKMHIERHHKEELEKESGEGGKVDAKDAVKMLAQKQKDLLEVKLAEKSKQQSDKAKGIDSSSEITNVKDRSAKKIVVDSAPVIRASVKQPRTILDEFTNKKKDIRKPRYVPQQKKDSTDENANKWICKVVLPDKYKPDSDIVLWMNDVAPSKEEAIQRGATLALARYATNLPLQRLLPHEYKEKFERYEKEEKTRLEKKEQREKRELEKKNSKPKPKRIIPTLHMSEEKRLMVEELLKEAFECEESSTMEHHRSYDDFTVLHETDEEIANPEVEALTARLEKLGFEKSDATIAVKQSKDFAYESALDWLVINIPESRLPAKFAPKAMNDPIVLLNNANKPTTTSSSRTTAKENSVPAKDSGDIRLLWERGYSIEEAKNAVKTASSSSVSPMIVAYRNRLGPKFTISLEKQTNDEWDDEIVAIESIYGDENVKKDDKECAISVSVENKMLVTFMNVFGYPQTAPPLIYLSHMDSSSSDSSNSREKIATCLEVAVATALECIESESGPCMYSVIDAIGTELSKEETTKSITTSSSTKATQKLSSSLSSSSAAPKPRNTNAAPPPPPLANQQGDTNTNRNRNNNNTKRNNVGNQLSRAQIEEQSARLKDAYDLWQRDFKSNEHSAAFKMQTVRNNLPASESRDKITKLVENNAVVVLSGETGCGKSTQVPQFILEHAIFNQKGGETNIICTQPRRISAIGLAERVANERDEKVGGVVGYSVRLESKTSKETRLLFCTTGILLRRLLSDSTLENVTHVILDEVHERSVDSDVLLLLLRRVVQKRPKLKLVLMSATADADLFADYFQTPSKRSTENGIKAVKTSKITIPGFTHPVKEYYLEDVFNETRFLVGQKSKYAKNAAEKKRQLALLESEEDSVDPNAFLPSSSDDDDEDDAHRADREVPESWDVAELDEIVSSSKKQRKKKNVEGDRDEDEDDEDSSDDDEEEEEEDNWALDKKQAAEKRAAIPKLSLVSTKMKNNEDIADENMKRRKEEEERERQTELALARKYLENNYSDDVKRSIQNVDESILNYELIENALSAIIRKELKEGMESIVPKGGKLMEKDTYGAFLIFMPGQAEILKLIRVFEQSRLLEVSDVGELDFLPLYGQLSAAEQRRIFQKPRLGVRKIVVATNIAETSVTIDDIRYVIDTGRQKEMRYDSERGLSCLEDCWVSKAQAKQRRGRAGRTTPGACFRLFSRTQFANFEQTQAPEMLRTPLQSLVLNIKSMAPESGTAKETLSLALTPPDENALDLAVQELNDLKAMAIVNDEEVVTPLGKHLTHMPCDPRLGKMLVYASLLGCLDPMLTIASAMSGRPLFYSPRDNREDADKKKRAFAVGKSDHLAVVNAFDGWLNAKKRGGRGAERRFCDENYLSSQALEAVLQSRVDFAQILSDLGFVSRNYALRVKRFGRAKDDMNNTRHKDVDLNDEVDINSNVSRIIKAALVAGLYPKLVRVQHPVAKYAKTLGGAVEKMASGKEMKYYSRDVGRVFLHPTSVNFNVGKYESTWLVYGDRVQTAKVFVRDCTMVGSYPLLLFGGELDVKHEQGKLVLDDWCEFNAPAKIGVLARELRKKIDQLLTNKVNSPGPISMDNKVVKAMLTLIESEGM